MKASIFADAQSIEPRARVGASSFEVLPPTWA